MTGAGVLHGHSIILTRAIDDAAALAERLQALGADVVSVPLTQVLASADGGVALEKAAETIADYHWVVFTSANGARAFAQAWRSAKGQGATWPSSVQVAAVGPTTAQVVESLGMPVGFVPSTASGADLAAEFPTSLTAGVAKILAPQAELASSTVHDGLAAKGYVVDQVIAYRTGAPAIDPVMEPAVQSAVGSADAVVFASPSAVSRFVDRFGREVAAAVICIGPATAKRADKLGLTVAATANPHTEEGLFAAVHGLLVDEVC